MPRSKRAREERSYCTVDIHDHRSVKLGSLQRAEAPDDLKESFKICSDWYDDSWWVRTIVGLKQAFFNSGFRVRKTDKSKAFLEENAEWFYDYVRSVWQDRLIYSNVITLWLENAPGILNAHPLTLPLECCDYTDALGFEKLKFYPKWKASDLPDELKKEFTGTVVLDPTKGRRFKVLKTCRVGDGLGQPSMYSAFRILSQAQGMDVQGSLCGFLARSPIRQHLLGHEIKQGSKAGTPAHFWKKERGDAIEKKFKGQVGFMEITTNFDHVIKYVTIDPKVFDGKKWDDVLVRLQVWAGAVGYMLLAKTPAPYLMNLLKQEALAERELVERHVETVIKEAYDTELELQWSNRCFNDPRVALEYMKMALTSGAGSQSSFLQEGGLDPEEEKANKEAEHKDPLHQHLPIFDPAHGDRPGRKPNGRPSGTPDPATG